MARSLCVLALTTALVALVDVAHKAVAIAGRGGSVLAHPRSALYVLGLTVALAIWVGAILLTRSPAIALGGGIVAGGATGNLVSLALWPSLSGVPNPLVARGIAFNVADLAVTAGFVLVGVTTAAFAAQNREQLREPVRIRSQPA
jgi:lipoprotein signal peptidase